MSARHSRETERIDVRDPLRKILALLGVSVAVPAGLLHQQIGSALDAALVTPAPVITADAAPDTRCPCNSSHPTTAHPGGA